MKEGAVGGQVEEVGGGLAHADAAQRAELPPVAPRLPLLCAKGAYHPRQQKHLLRHLHPHPPASLMHPIPVLCLAWVAVLLVQPHAWPV